MDTYRQKHPWELTAEQRRLALQKDSELETETQNLADPFYQKKRDPGGNPAGNRRVQSGKLKTLG